MSDLRDDFNQYKAQHGHAPNATQLALVAGVKYREASSFLRDMQDGIPTSPKSKNKRVRSQTLSFTTPSKTTFTSQTKARTSSFSDDVLYGDEKSNKTSPSSSNIDYSGSTTGANNPWKKFQKKSSSSAYSSFSHSFTPTKPISKPKPQKDISAPKQPIPKPHTNIPTSRSMPSINITQLQSDLISLNAKYERECKQIRLQFEEIRNELTKKENVIIGNLTKYTNECRSMMEKALKTSVTTIDHDEKEKQEYVDVLPEVEEKSSDNQWKKKKEDVTSKKKPSSRSTVKTFAPKVSNPDVDSDEWSNSESASW